jgi:hypothetical protein
MPFAPRLCICLLLECLQQKIVAWASIFLSLVAFTHGTVESDYRQMMMGIS